MSIFGFGTKRCRHLKIKINRIGEIPRCMVLRLIGHLDPANARCFLKRASKIIADGYIRLIIDLSKYELISELGVGLFLSIQKDVAACGGKIVLIGTERDKPTLPLLFCCDDLFVIESKIDDAIKLLSSEVAG